MKRTVDQPEALSGRFQDRKIHIAIVTEADAKKDVKLPQTARIAFCTIVLPGFSPGPGNSLSGVTTIDRNRLTADVA